MKSDVTNVNLIGLGELNPPPRPLQLTDYTYTGLADDTTLFEGYRNTWADIAALVSSALGSGSIKTTRYYKIGVRMPAGSSLSTDRRQIIDPYLNGLIYDVHRRGYEWMEKGYEWDNTVSGGGVQLLGGSGTTGDPYDTFTNGELVAISFAPTFSPYIPAPDAIGRLYNGEVTYTASTNTILSADYRKRIVLASAGTTMTCNVPPASDYPANVILTILSEGGSHKQATLHCAGSDVILYDGQQFPDFWLGQSAQINLVPTKKSLTSTTYDAWRVIWFSEADHWQSLGVVQLAQRVGKNQWCAANAATPSTQLRAVYPRVWYFIQKLQSESAAQVVSGAAWNSNMTLWSTGDGSTTFNFPECPGEFIRFWDPHGLIDIDRYTAGKNNIPMSQQAQQLAGHAHQISATTGDTIIGRHDGGPGDNIGVNNVAGGWEKKLPNITQSTGGGAENRSRNITFIPVINI